MAKGTILISAGGTGGHLFPAEALAYELKARGWNVPLATDERATRYADRFPEDKLHVIHSATPSGKNPFKVIGAVWSLFKGMRQSSALLRIIKPKAVVGFGGYPTVPPLWSAAGHFPTVIHEQNAVMGRANKMLSGRQDRRDRQSGAASGDRGLGQGLPSAGKIGSTQACRVWRQPGRAVLFRHGPRGDCLVARGFSEPHRDRSTGAAGR